MSDLTNKHIEELRDEARAHGDEHMELVCVLAVDGYLESTAFRGATFAQRCALARMTRDEARAECARVIHAARAAREQEYNATIEEQALTTYQEAVIETWIAQAHVDGDDREDAIQRVLCAIDERAESAIRTLFDRRWPAEVV